MKIKRKFLLMIIFSVFITQTVLAAHTNNYPNSFTEFRDSVYLQNKSLHEIMRLYAAAKQEIEKSFSSADKYLLLARCEYLMGITFRVENRNSEAAACFEQGITRAEEAVKIRPTSEGYRLLGTNISFLCEVKTTYGLKNFKKIEENARKALELDPDNLTAHYLIAAFYISAPWPVCDVKKGFSLLEEIMKRNYTGLDWEDQFNLFLMLQAGCIKLKNIKEAERWRDRCTAIYPSNNFIKFLIK
ncbi:MAG: hypothetical protein FWC22_00730 [Treponema sp.]|nr:hypothetical protein [Treponema sp.]